MARLSTLAQLPAILNAAEQWKDKCLLGDVFGPFQFGIMDGIQI